MPTYRAKVVQLSLILLVGSAPGFSIDLELQGEGTPPLYPFDGVTVEFKRVEAGPTAPPVAALEPVQRMNGVAVNVHNNAPENALLVNVGLQLAAPEINLYVGDIVEVNLTVVAAGAYNFNTPPAPQPHPVPQPIPVPVPVPVATAQGSTSQHIHLAT